MRLLIALAIATTALLPAGAAAAAETGTIRGRVVDGSTGEPRAGARVTLQGGNEDGSDPIRASVETRADGRFVFDDLETGDERVYVVDASFEGGLFAGRALQLPADTRESPVIETTIKVWDTTTDPTVMAITRDDLFLLPSGGGIAVIESIAMVNASDRAYIGRGGDDGAPGETPSVGFAVPDEAQDVRILDSNLDIPRLVPAEFGFGATIAIPPGLTRTTFTYRLTETAAQHDVSRTVLYPTSEINVHTRPPLTVESNRLVEAGEKSIEGTPYRVWTTDERVDAGDSLQILAIAEAGTPTALIGGIGAFAALLLAAGAVAMRRRGGARTKPRRRKPDRDAVMTAIARLDVKYESGDIDRDAWERERDRLKGLLTDGGPPP